MKILLIAPASGCWRKVGQRRLNNGKTFRFSLLSLLSVAAATPSGHSIRIVDEQCESVPWGERFDLVGITCMTALAPRAYELAQRFRQLGTPVILGGMHPTFLPDEALRYADAVVAGEAETVWPQAIEDAGAGRLSGVYRSNSAPELSRLKTPPYELLNFTRYSTYAVQATRGCDRKCSFCSISAFHHQTQRQRPVAEVANEVRRIPGRFFIFVDDNLTADRDYALQLFDALKPLGKHWVTQSTLSVSEDRELMDSMAKAGCVGLFAGLETFSEVNLTLMEKSFNRLQQYEDSIRHLHSRGIGVEAGIVFGFDHDGPDVFSRTLAMMDRLEIDAAQISIFTPLPGTSVYEQMKTRLIDMDWGRYDLHHAVFQPKGMSAEALKAGHDWVTREFYRPWRIARRLSRWSLRPHGIARVRYAAAINWAYWGRIRQWGIRGWDPGEEYSIYPHPGVEIPAV